MLLLVQITPKNALTEAPRKRSGAAAPEKPAEGLEFPRDGVELARNARPVILLHGTLVEKEGIAAYRDFSLRQGHPVDYRTYPSITKGNPIEESAVLASQNINRARMEIAGKNLEKLSGADSKKIESFFQLDANLYGAHDKDADAAQKLLSPLLDEVAGILKEDGLEHTFSGKLKDVQARLAGRLQSARVTDDKASKMAAELVDSLAPKAIVVGHSAGGYVGYTLTVNPELTPDKDPFTYDGGNGIAEMLSLSAPIGKGLPTPAPPGILGLGFYNVDANVLRPIENLPGSQLTLLNPLFNFGYHAWKGLAKQAFYVANYVTIGLTNPLTHKLRPSNAQVEENSEFFNSYLKDKPIPEGVSVIAVTSPLDQLSQAERSMVDASKPNAHNFSADLRVSEADLKRERPTWSHVIMTEKPDAFKEQFAEHLLDPATLDKVLHPSNDDGVRYEALQMLAAELKTNPKALTRSLRKALQTVASERAPFKDSPSYLAQQILS